MVSLVVALALVAGGQSPSADRRHAEHLARAGRSAEAMELFIRIAAEDPNDIEAVNWVGRLALRLGRAADAERAFRTVLRDHPADVDARIGLGTALMRQGESNAALRILTETERDAGENADLFASLARAYRRAGDDRRALEYFRRAKALAPADPDVVSGFEATAQAYGHAIAFEGFGARGRGAPDSESGSFAVDVRVAPRFHLQATARAQEQSGASDALAGGGAFWRAGRATTVSARAAAGPGNDALATSDVFGEVIHYPGVFEVGGSLRRLTFAGAQVIAASPAVAWDSGGRWRLAARYTYSHSHFDGVDASNGDHSVLVRDTWRGWRRVWINLSYAYGIESFEQLTADRLGALGTTTAAAGIRIGLPSLTTVTTTWEHQWRSNETSVDRVTLSLVQSFP